MLRSWVSTLHLDKPESHLSKDSIDSQLTIRNMLDLAQENLRKQLNSSLSIASQLQELERLLLGQDSQDSPEEP